MRYRMINSPDYYIHVNHAITVIDMTFTMITNFNLLILHKKLRQNQTLQELQSFIFNM